MAEIITWLQTNWLQLLGILLFIDTALIGIFPQAPILGSVKSILQALVGTTPPAPPPAS